ncbi:hypothetical protein CPB86DRAFT_696848 [Serendipita vermifera]|nr:hypothetical protein CPB86DRAFT_696848 [Serendipita vermifera]
MSKLTSQEIIDRGDYLEPNFDASSLLVANLRAILQHHDVSFAANASKAALIQAFEDNIVPNAKKYKRIRQANAAIRSDASDILDGETGNYLEPPIRRRSSRKSAVETPRRVPSASPTRKSRKSAAALETSAYRLRNEDESDDAALTSSNISSRPRKGRRVSQKWGAGDQSSMWEDNNPFQRASPRLEDMSSSVNKPRKSSARPSSGHEPGPSATEQKIFPVAGSLDLGSISNSVYQSQATPRQSFGAETITPGDDNENETFDEHDSQIDSPYLEDDNHNRLVSEKIASLGTRASNGIVSTRRKQSGLTVWQQLLSTLAVVLVATILWLYKSDSVLLGYCDPGTNVNEAVRLRLEEIQAEKACQEIVIKRAEAGLPVDPDLEKCKAPLLPRATRCTPCPAHAVCTGRSIECEPAYIKSSSAFSSIPFVDAILDGMPGFGPVAFPPRCVPNVKRRQHVGKMAGAIENKLAFVRGQRVCSGVHSTGGNAQDAAAYGMTVDEMKQGLRNVVPKSINNFDEIFDQAIKELDNNGLLVSVRDISGRRYYASIREEMSYICQINLAARRTWKAWQNSVILAAAVVVLVLILRSNLTKRALESRRVSKLVKEAIERVKEQEARHYLDPTGYPSATISSLQLRDELLQDEHSLAKRARLWDQVEKIVEVNSNVRSNMEVTSTGDEGRVWTWVGTGGGRTKFIEGNGTGRPLI